MNLVLKNTRLFLTKQECIPVGCVPSPAEAICWGGGLPTGGCQPGGRVSTRGGGICLEGGVSPGGGCLPERGGVSAQGGVSAWGCLPDPSPL